MVLPKDDGTAVSKPARPTRERILDNALRLFAERGYEATSIGEIESAAGLVPRSGALYKHFPSKRALIDAALAERFRDIDSLDEQVAMLRSGDLRAELTVIGRLTLAELERERDLSRLVMKEGERFPELADAFHDGIVVRGHATATAWVESTVTARGCEVEDCAATAQVLMDALVGYALQQHMFGDRLTAVEPERLIAAWTEIALDHLDPEPAEGVQRR